MEGPARVTAKPSHTPLFGSTSYRTLKCPAHYQRSIGLPESPSSEAAIEGTMLHGVAERILLHPETEADELADLTQDQRRIVDSHVSTVRGLVKGGRLYVEKRSEAPHLHKFWYGTADAVIINGSRLTIADLKCGRVAVEVQDDDGAVNAQLASYAISILESLKASIADKITEIELVIVQPRNGGTKRTTISREELDEVKRKLIEAGDLAESDDPPAKAGSHCRFCRAKPTCPTIRDFVSENAKLDFALDDAAPADLTPAELHQVLAAAEIAKDWIKSVEQHAERVLSEGGDINGEWELIPKRAIRKWKDERAVNQRLLSEGLAGKDFTKEVILSPAQVEAVAREKNLTLDISDLISAESSGMKLARKQKEDDNDSVDDWV
jgi:CRISPR/Cas system-associated exonuclease Cas4 (RecB family)